jgi:hypothetical protein
MIARVANVTPALLALLRTRNDDGTPELRVEGGSMLLDSWPNGEWQIVRTDGAELSATERQHVEAALAAHSVTPIL